MQKLLKNSKNAFKLFNSLNNGEKKFLNDI